MARSRVKGAASYRRFLRRLPDSSTNQLRALLTSAAPQLAAYMRSLFPTRTGRARRSIGFKGPNKALNVRIGQVDKKAARDAFYAHILDVGFKSGQKRVNRHHAAAAGQKRRGLGSFAASYTVRWTGRPGIRSRGKTLRYFRTRFLPDYRKLTDRILAEASRGVGND